MKWEDEKIDIVGSCEQSKLGLSRRALIYKLEKYGLKPPPGAK